MLTVSTIGAIIPFWFYNVFGNQRAGHKLFMGDTGSLTLGVLLGFLAIKSFTLHHGSEVSETRYMIVAFSTLLVPMFDVIRVACFRMLRKHNPFLPDKNHIHHNLIRTGMRIRFVMLTIILIDISFIIINYLLAGLLNVTFVICIDIFIWIALQLIIDQCAKAHEIHTGLAHDDRGNVFQESDPSLFGTEIATKPSDEDDDN
jgi:UDP-GlcNAc:undecaprenyl-phosphate GlcNAc-1-phosphate transferase